MFWKYALLGGVLLLGLGGRAAFAQRPVWEALSRVTRAQQIYYRQNRRFTAALAPLERLAGVRLPRGYDYGIRTTSRGAYLYAIPFNRRLQPLVSAIFLDPAASGPNRMTMVVCQALTAGRFRPADPIFRPGADPIARRGEIACGDGTVIVDGPFDL
ncbi:MAG: type IV pilin-like G/H family protein [Gloeomargarita sp. SKYG98]|nr:type IV pilin-like G/H family protein [Gloeomargarita sp. SKYG98]